MTLHHSPQLKRIGTLAALLFALTQSTNCSTATASPPLEKRVVETAEPIPKNPPASNQWEAWDRGLSVGYFSAPQQSEYGNSIITVVKIDPRVYSFKLLTAKELNNPPLTADRWAEEYGLTAVINAGMFEPDWRATGYMKSPAGENNPRFRPTYNSIFAFDPYDLNNTTTAPVQIIDASCQNVNETTKRYRSAAQSIRLIDCRQRNVWAKQNKKWSMAALAMDTTRNVLLIHSRSPYTVHDFINHLQELPLHIYNAMYLEGGPEASLAVRTPERSLDAMGSYETGFLEHDKNTRYWSIPNVLGAVRRQ